MGIVPADPRSDCFKWAQRFAWTGSKIFGLRLGIFSPTFDVKRCFIANAPVKAGLVLEAGYSDVRIFLQTHVLTGVCFETHTF